jgi:hypothetical protein
LRYRTFAVGLNFLAIRQSEKTLDGILYNEIELHLERVCDLLQSCGCSLFSSALQVGKVTLSDVSLVRDIELRFTAPPTQHAQRILTVGNSVNDLFRNERNASGNVFARSRDGTRSAEIFVGFLCLGGKSFVVLARQDSDLAVRIGCRSSVVEHLIGKIFLIVFIAAHTSPKSHRCP